MPRRRKVSCETKDVIGELPKVIIEKILECLPIREAGRTSILSRKWRYYWKTLPQLVFGRVFFEGAVHENILRDINAVLRLHIGPITNFVLQIPEISLPQFDDHVDLWVLFLSLNGIKKLNLENSIPDYAHKSPSNLLSCLKLTHLKLCNYTFQPVRGFKGFQFLSTLDFFKVTILSDELEVLISSSPMLENLTLSSCCVVNHFVIHAPKLSFLRVHGAYKFSLRETPNLAVAFVHLTKMDGQLTNGFYNLKHIIQTCLSRIERLVVGNDTLQILSAVANRAKLPTTLVCLKYLEIHETSFCTNRAFLSAAYVIAVSPKLQELKISSGPFDLEGRDGRLSSTWTLPQLQIVRLQHIKGFVQELELIKFLLASSPILQSMVIERGIDIPANNEIKLLRGLLQYPRASLKVKITYLEPSAGVNLS